MYKMSLHLQGYYKETTLSTQKNRHNSDIIIIIGGTKKST